MRMELPPDSKLLRGEFVSLKEAALFAQRDADGHQAHLKVMAEDGTTIEKTREIPPPPGVAAKPGLRDRLMPFF